MYFLALDEGTSSTRAILYNEQGRVCFKSQHALTTTYPKLGWVEQDPEEIWEKTCLALREVVSQVNVADIKACGITNQRETTVIWDKKTHHCLGPAISWQDTRTESLFKQFSDAELELMQSKTGLIPNAYFSASKLQWLLKNVPKAQDLAASNRLAFGTIDAYLLWRLTQGEVHATDVTNASRTLLFDIETCQWSDNLLALFDIPISVLPKALSNDAVFGDIHPSIVGASIPITAMVGDQQSSLIGQACIESGMMKTTFGSGAFLLLNTGEKPVRSPHLLTTVAYQVKEKTHYGIEGSIYHAGTILKWLKNGLNILTDYAETESISKSVASSDGVYFLPSFTSLGAPHWMTPPGALITGITQHSTSAHIIRSALETVVYQTNDIIRCIQSNTTTPLHVLHADGGMAQNAWFMQYLASTCNIVVKRPQEVETTAFGAAMLAAVGCGYLESLSDVALYWTSGQTFVPDEARISYEQAYKGWVEVIASVKRSMLSL